ncbi:MAG: OmpA family protein [Polyangiales bacterium]
MASVFLMLGLAATASAQTGGFAIDRFEASERGSDWFVLDSLPLHGHATPALGVLLDYGYKPLVLRDPSGRELGQLVKHQLFLHLGGSFVLWSRLRLAGSLPLAAAVRGDGVAAAPQYGVDEGAALGDLRLSADVRLFGKYRGALTGAVGARLWLPTGTRAAFSGDGKVRLSPHATLAGELGRIAYAARLGFSYRAHDGAFAGSKLGSELLFGVAAGVRALDGKLLVGPEVHGSTVVQGGAFRERGTPVEGLLGAHYTHAETWRFGAGVGTGFTQGLGSPELRVVASAEWAPQPRQAPPPPPPSDRDQDQILDRDDACPDEPGLSHADASLHGCPLRDRDGDDVLDRDDACAEVAGIHSVEPAKNGCPASDRDEDSVLDELDACPDDAGPTNADPARSGCPAARIERGQIRILDQVQFETGSATLLPVSYSVLKAVTQLLLEHPEVGKVSIEGHTDNVGTAEFNKRLSNQRVLSVLRWLADHGVELSRLASAGFGAEYPVTSNGSEDGRRLNRRVEFHIREIDGKLVGAKRKQEPAPGATP